MDNCSDEVWLPVRDYEGIYEVSDHGRVRNARPNYYTGYYRILRQTSLNGWPRVRIYKRGKGLSIYTHRLVAFAFLGLPDERNQVNHKDGNKTNNRPSNLEWVTNRENQRHAVEHGLKATGARNGRNTMPERTARGAQNGKSKLLPAQIEEIRAKYIPRKISHSKLAKEYGVSKAAIAHILQGRTWAHI